MVLDAQVKKYKEVFIEACKQVSTPVIDKLSMKRLSGSLIRKSRFIFTKERRTIRQKSSCLKHLNERMFTGKHPDAGADQGFLERGFICIKDVGFALWILSHLKYSMKMK